MKIKSLINKIKMNQVTVKMFHQHFSKCIACNTPRQMKINGIKYKNCAMYKIGNEIAMDMLYKHGILVSPQRKVCDKCRDDILLDAETLKDALETWNELIWNKKKCKNEYKNIIKDKLLHGKLTIICQSLNLFKVINAYSLMTKKKKILHALQNEILLNVNEPKLKKYWKSYFGLTKMEFTKVLNEVINSIAYEEVGIKIDTWKGKMVYFFKKKNKGMNVLLCYIINAKRR